jgi:hypothetical protein
MYYACPPAYPISAVLLNRMDGAGGAPFVGRRPLSRVIPHFRLTTIQGSFARQKLR